MCQDNYIALVFDFISHVCGENLDLMKIVSFFYTDGHYGC